MTIFGVHLDQGAATVVTALGVYAAYRLVDWLLPRGRYFKIVDWYSSRRNGGNGDKDQDRSQP